MKRFFVLLAIAAILGQLVLEGTYIPIFISLFGILLNPVGIGLIFLFLLYHYFVITSLMYGFGYLFAKKPMTGFGVFAIIVAVFFNPAFFLFLFPQLATLQ